MLASSECELISRLFSPNKPSSKNPAHPGVSKPASKRSSLSDLKSSSPLPDSIGLPAIDTAQTPASSGSGCSSTSTTSTNKKFSFGSSKSNSSSKSGHVSVAVKFQQQMSGLLTELQSSHPRFIRCLKPNNTMTPHDLQAPLVLQQLKTSGLVDALRLRSLGLPVRLSHQDFLSKYQHIQSPLTELCQHSAQVQSNTHSCASFSHTHTHILFMSPHITSRHIISHELSVSIGPASIRKCVCISVLAHFVTDQWGPRGIRGHLRQRRRSRRC